MATFDMMVWYTEDEYGKAWTTVEAETEEEARAILDKAFQKNEEYTLEWEYYAKGGGGTVFDPDNEVYCRKQENTNE